MPETKVYMTLNYTILQSENAKNRDSEVFEDARDGRNSDDLNLAIELKIDLHIVCCGGTAIPSFASCSPQIIIMIFLAMCCRFNLSRALIASTVIGATSGIQLRQLCDAASRGPLPEDILYAVDLIHQQYPNPTP